MSKKTKLDAYKEATELNKQESVCKILATLHEVDASNEEIQLALKLYDDDSDIPYGQAVVSVKPLLRFDDRFTWNALWNGTARKGDRAKLVLTRLERLRGEVAYHIGIPGAPQFKGIRNPAKYSHQQYSALRVLCVHWKDELNKDELP